MFRRVNFSKMSAVFCENKHLILFITNYVHVSNVCAFYFLLKKKNLFLNINVKLLILLHCIINLSRQKRKDQMFCLQKCVTCQFLLSFIKLSLLFFSCMSSTITYLLLCVERNTCITPIFLFKLSCFFDYIFPPLR